jgi:hypothetical protein
MATLTCKQCGHVNEEARIYCHNCGVKLDRSLLEEEAPPQQMTEKSRRQIKKMMNPSRFPLSAWVRLIANSLLCGAVAASLISSVRPPDGVPPMHKKESELVDAPPIAMELERLKELGLPQKVALPVEAINAYLFKAIKPNQPSSISDKIKFVRTFVQLEEGVCRVNIEQSIFDYSLYAGAAYKLEAKDGKLEATNVGGNVGRLPLHPKVMEYAGKYVFQTLWDSLARERKLVDDVQSIEVHKDRIELVTKSMRR